MKDVNDPSNDIEIFVEKWGCICEHFDEYISLQKHITVKQIGRNSGGYHV